MTAGKAAEPFVIEGFDDDRPDGFPSGRYHLIRFVNHSYVRNGWHSSESFFTDETFPDAHDAPAAFETPSAARKTALRVRKRLLTKRNDKEGRS